MLKKLFVSLFLVLLFSNYSEAITTTTCPGAGCVNTPVAGMGSIGIQVTGTWVGTITFQSTIDNTNYVSFRTVSIADTNSVGITTTTGNGIFNGTVAGINQIRVVFTAWTSGTAVVTFRATSQAARFSLPEGAGDGSVTSVATSSPITGGTITGTGTIACGTCGVTGTGLQQFASTTSAQLAGILSNETGTGVAVFNDTPTLITPVLGVATATTVTSATIKATNNYQSSDGTNGLTATCTLLSITAIVVKNGLITSCS